MQTGAHHIGNVSAVGQVDSGLQPGKVDRLTGIAQALRSKRHFLNQHVRCCAAVVRGEAVFQRVRGNFQRASDITGIETPQHDGHDNVILRTTAISQHTGDPRRIERQQLALFLGFTFV